MNVMHRDIKSANIMITSHNGEQMVKLGDMNVSKVATTEGMNYT